MLRMDAEPRRKNVTGLDVYAFLSDQAFPETGRIIGFENRPRIYVELASADQLHQEGDDSVSVLLSPLGLHHYCVAKIGVDRKVLQVAIPMTEAHVACRRHVPVFVCRHVQRSDLDGLCRCRLNRMEFAHGDRRMGGSVRRNLQTGLRTHAVSEIHRQGPDHERGEKHREAQRRDAALLAS